VGHAVDGAEPRILVVDDEEPARRLLCVQVAARGYRVVEAASGQAGLSTAATLHPDLVIVDLELPDLDGLDVIRRLREWSNTLNKLRRKIESNPARPQYIITEAGVGHRLRSPQ
jgi:DNA-binding response OmpR family regulator